LILPLFEAETDNTGPYAAPDVTRTCQTYCHHRFAMAPVQILYQGQVGLAFPRRVLMDSPLAHRPSFLPLRPTHDLRLHDPVNLVAVQLHPPHDPTVNALGLRLSLTTKPSLCCNEGDACKDRQNRDQWHGVSRLRENRHIDGHEIY